MLEFLRNEVHIDNIHIIAHSMGNRIVLKSLDKAIAQAAPSLGEVIFAAADIPQLTFRELAVTVRRVAKGMTLYASAHDAALWWSSNVAGQLPRAGSVINNAPLVVAGVESIDMSAVNPTKSLLEKAAEHDLLGLNTHNSFVSPVIVDIARLLWHGEHPPDQRTSNIRGFPEGAAAPTYWYYARSNS